MQKIEFTKMAGAMNDFVVIDSELKAQGSRLKGLSALAKRLCDRKTGIGADGMLILEKSKIADFRMRIFNTDGSEAEMCGNGLRCAVLFTGIKRKVKVETIAGIHEGEIISEGRVKVKMEDSKDLKLNFPINVNGRKIKANFINIGVPHAVIFVEGLKRIDAKSIGAQIRYHDEFKPKGSNVNFAEIIDDKNIKIRTYERGVEGETLACGTGSVASAIISSLKVPPRLRSRREGSRFKVSVHTRGGVLKVEFSKIGNRISEVYLEGEAKVVFKGNIIL